MRMPLGNGIINVVGTSAACFRPFGPTTDRPSDIVIVKYLDDFRISIALVDSRFIESSSH